MRNYYNSNSVRRSRPETPPGRMITDNCAVEKFPIAMAYVPRQIWRDVTDAHTGLCNGTIFEELNLPFTGKCVKRGNG